MRTIYDVRVAIDAVVLVNFAVLVHVLLPELGVVLHAVRVTTILSDGSLLFNGGHSERALSIKGEFRLTARHEE